MKVKTPSKYLSIEFLKTAQDNYYLSPNGQEYCPEELDMLLHEKIDNAQADYDFDAMAEYLEHEARLSNMECFLGVYINIQAINSGSL